MKKRYFLVPLLIFIIGILILVNRQGKNYQELPFSSNTALPVSNTSKVEYSCEKGKTAYQLLEEKNQVESSESNLGKYVVAINGVKQAEGKYWLYSVDEKEATVSATSYICQNNEKIIWELK